MRLNPIEKNGIHKKLNPKNKANPEPNVAPLAKD